MDRHDQARDALDRTRGWRGHGEGQRRVRAFEFEVQIKDCTLCRGGDAPEANQNWFPRRNRRRGGDREAGNNAAAAPARGGAAAAAPDGAAVAAAAAAPGGAAAAAPGGAAAAVAAAAPGGAAAATPAACAAFDDGQSCGRKGKYYYTDPTNQQEKTADVFQFALKRGKYVAKLAGTKGDLQQSTVREWFRDGNTGRWAHFQRPRAFATWGDTKHAVDDNNNMRQRLMNLEAGWPTKNPIQRHLLLPFAIAETNAHHCWNFFNPDNRHSKRSWRKALAKQLLTSTSPQQQGDHGRCGFRKLADHEGWSKRMRRLVKGQEVPVQPASVHWWLRCEDVPLLRM